jgi:hypothetical protein
MELQDSLQYSVSFCMVKGQISVPALLTLGKTYSLKRTISFMRSRNRRPTNHRLWIEFVLPWFVIEERCESIIFCVFSQVRCLSGTRYKSTNQRKLMSI